MEQPNETRVAGDHLHSVWRASCVASRHVVRLRATSLLVLLWLVPPICDSYTANAQDRWPPWQSYGEAEGAAAARLRLQKHRAGDLTKLNQQIEQLKQAGKIADAIPLAQRAVVASERQHGRNHPDVAKALDTLAALYIEENKLVEAEPLLKKSLAIQERATPPNSSDLARALDKLAELYEKQGRSADADPLLKRAAAIREQAATDSSGVVYEKKSVVPFEPDVVEGKLAKPTAPPAATTSPADKPESPDAGKAGETHPEPLPTASDTAPEANGLSRSCA
jgi:tetratricopeptide (TPR) repeat protein